MRNDQTSSILTLAALMLAGLVGCGDQSQIRVYETDKPAGAVVPVAVEAPVELDGLVYSLPDGWESLGAGNMVLAQYQSPGTGVKLSVSRAGGALTGNINRWRGQLGMQPVPGEVNPASLETLDSPAGAVLVVDLVSDEGDDSARRFRVGLLSHRVNGVPTGESWFFKVDGPASAIESQREGLDRMFSNLKWVEDGSDG